MIFFLNRNFHKQIRGIARGSMNRMLRFKEKWIQVKIVIDEYNNRLYKNVVSRGLDFGDFIGRYDFFQEATNMGECSVFNIENKMFSNYTAERSPKTANFRLCNDGGDRLAEIHCFDNDARIDYMDYFDAAGRKTTREIYDIRGFRSSTIAFSESGDITSKTYYTANGKIAIREFFTRNENGSPVLTLIIVNYEGGLFVFNSANDFRTFFLNELLLLYSNSKMFGKKDVFIYDVQRPEWANPLMQLKDKAAKVLVFHDSVVKPHENPLTGAVKGSHRFAVNRLKSYDALVVMTEDQKRDIVRRFGAQIPIYVIPGGGIGSAFCGGEKNIKKHKIISVARYSAEKRQDHIISAFDKLKDRLPRAELHLFGYGEDGKRKLKEMIANLKLENRVFIGDYAKDIAAQYNSADLFVLTGLYEGIPAVLFEAAGCGVPQVAYDVGYGPKAVIAEAGTGLLAEDGNIDDLADKIYTILGDDKLREQMSNNCAAIRGKYSEKEVFRKWKTLLTDQYGLRR